MLTLEMLSFLEVITNAQQTLEAAHLKENAFTRERGMPFPNALGFLLDMRKTTLQTRLNAYYKNVKGGDPISQQAFSKLRMNFDHSPFETMVRELVKKEYLPIPLKPPILKAVSAQLRPANGQRGLAS